MNENVNLMEQNVIQVNGGITINVDVSIKKIMFGILLHVIMKMENRWMKLFVMKL